MEDNLFLGQEPRDDIVIVAIDDASIQQIGRWPWSRGTMAELIELISRTQPKILGIDINFPEPAVGDELLIKSLEQNFPIVLPVEVVLEMPSLFREAGPLRSYQSLAPVQEIAQAVELGFANTPPDTDGVVRRIPLKILDPQDKFIQSFSYKIASLVQEQRIQLPVDDYERLIINYVGRPASFTYLSAKDIFEPDFDQAKLQGKVALLGATAPDLHDVWFTPTAKAEPMPGVEVNANLIQTILNKNFLQAVPPWVTVATIMLLAFMFGLAVMRLKARWNILLFFAIIIIYLLAVIMVFDLGYILNIIYPVLTSVFCFLFLVIYRYVYEEGEKREVRRAFEFYLSPRVIEELLKDPQKLSLGGEKRQITIMFSDIRGFTSLAEGLTPEELGKLLNEYLTQMTGIVLGSDGVLDKYIGDAIMAFWGAPFDQPHHAERAARTALRMIEVLDQYNREKKWPAGREINIGIGLNTGEAVVGNMGAVKRFDYTVIGDAVNLGSRAESLNKQYGTRIIITEFTRNELGEEFITRLLDKVAVKGKERGVIIYELICTKDKLVPKQKDIIEMYEQAWKYYQNRKWEKSLEILRSLSRLTQDDMAVKSLIERCENFKKDPPPRDWDGVWRLKEK